MKSDKALLQYSSGVGTWFTGKMKYNDVVAAIIYIKFLCEHSKHQN